MTNDFKKRLEPLRQTHEALLVKPNAESELSNGVITRYKNAVLTAMHTPLQWRYDFNPATNPFLMERFGINAVFNSGAIKYKGKFILGGRKDAAWKGHSTRDSGMTDGE